MKICVKHREFFPKEDDWLPKTEDYFYEHPTTRGRWFGHCRRCQSMMQQKDGRTLIGSLRRRYSLLNQRCNNPNDPAFKDYGARGIQNLFTSFDNFVNYVLFELGIPIGGIDNLYLDRIDNDEGYKPGNIRFCSPKVSANNRRQNGGRPRKIHRDVV